MWSKEKEDLFQEICRVKELLGKNINTVENIKNKLTNKIDFNLLKISFFLFIITTNPLIAVDYTTKFTFCQLLTKIKHFVLYLLRRRIT